MQRLKIIIILLIVVHSFSKTSQAAQELVVFLDQTKTVNGRLEWNREIITKKAGSINIKIRVKERGKFSIILITDDDYQIVIRKKPEPTNFKPKPLINIDAVDSYEGSVKLEEGTYWFIIENQEDTERNINLICSQIKS